MGLAGLRPPWPHAAGDAPAGERGGQVADQGQRPGLPLDSGLGNDPACSLFASLQAARPRHVGRARRARRRAGPRRAPGRAGRRSRASAIRAASAAAACPGPRLARSAPARVITAPGKPGSRASTAPASRRASAASPSRRSASAASPFRATRLCGSIAIAASKSRRASGLAPAPAAPCRDWRAPARSAGRAPAPRHNRAAASS